MLDNQTGSFLSELGLFVVRRRIGATSKKTGKKVVGYLSTSFWLCSAIVRHVETLVRNLVSIKITSLRRVKNQGWDFSFESRQWPSSLLLYARFKCRAEGLERSRDELWLSVGKSVSVYLSCFLRDSVDTFVAAGLASIPSFLRQRSLQWRVNVKNPTPLMATIRSERPIRSIGHRSRVRFTDQPRTNLSLLDRISSSSTCTLASIDRSIADRFCTQGRAIRPFSDTLVHDRSSNEYRVVWQYNAEPFSLSHIEESPWRANVFHLFASNQLQLWQTFCNDEQR